MKQITLVTQAESVHATFVYDQALIELVKSAPDRTWNNNSKQWLLKRCHANAQFILSNARYFTNPEAAQDFSQAPDIDIQHINQHLQINSIYRAEVVDFLRATGGQWNAHLLEWSIPVSSEQALIRLAHKLGLLCYVDGELITSPEPPTNPEPIKVLVEKQVSLTELCDRIENEPALHSIQQEFPYLRSYQVLDVLTMLSNARGFNANEPGLGKTVESAAAIVRQLASGLNHILVLCPSNIKRQWAEELLRFTGIQAIVVEGDANKRAERWLEFGDQIQSVAIANYETLRTKDWAVVSTIVIDGLILDEATRVKNFRTSNFKRAFALSVNVQWCWLLSGTPIESHISEIYTLFQFIDSHFFGTWQQFVRDYLYEDQWGTFTPRLHAAEQIGEKLGQCTGFFRWSKKSVLTELPDIIYTQQPVYFNAEEMREYKGIIKQIRLAKQNGQVIHSHSGIYISLRRLVSEPQLYRTDIQSTKKQQFVNFVKDIINGEKIVAFTWSSEVAASYCAALNEVGIMSVCVTSMSQKKANGTYADLDSFKDNPNCKVLIGTDTLSYGTNLQHASIVINIDLPYTPALYHQRNARCHRMGQKNAVTVVDFLVQDTIDIQVYDIIQSKQQDFDQAIEINAVELV